MTAREAGRRVLWVDDDSDLLSLMKRLLRGVVAVDACTSAEQALAAMGEGREYAVIVSDMCMPGMDGRELLRRVKESWPETVRVMFTGLDDQATAVQAMDDGRVFRFLTKGVPAAEIIDAIAAALHEHAVRCDAGAVLEGTLVGAVEPSSTCMPAHNRTPSGAAHAFAGSPRTSAASSG